MKKEQNLFLMTLKKKINLHTKKKPKMTSIIQNMVSLNSIGNGLIVQLYNVKNFMSEPNLRPEFASPANAKFLKSITSKFPETQSNDKVLLFF